MQKRASLEADLEELKIRRSFLKPARVSVGVRAADGRTGACQPRHPRPGQVLVIPQLPVLLPELLAGDVRGPRQSAPIIAPIAKPATCAQNATPPDAASAPIEPTPLKNCIRNQMPRKKSAGNLDEVR